MRKKFFSIILIFLMLFSSMPISAFANNNENDLRVYLSNHSGEITFSIVDEDNNPVTSMDSIEPDKNYLVTVGFSTTESIGNGSYSLEVNASGFDFVNNHGQFKKNDQGNVLGNWTFNNGILNGTFDSEVTFDSNEKINISFTIHSKSDADKYEFEDLSSNVTPPTEPEDTRVVTIKNRTDLLFKKVWNDNNSNVTNSTNMVDRPTIYEFKDNLTLLVSVDGGDYEPFSEELANDMDLDSIPEFITTNNQDDLVWNYNFNDIPTEYTVVETIDGETNTYTHTLEYAFFESDITGYIKDEVDDNTVKNTVMQKFTVTLNFHDNKNAYDTRFDLESLADLINVKAYKRGENKNNAVDVEITNDNILVSENSDGTFNILFLGLPAYDELGKPINYFLTINDELSSKPDDGEYVINYENVGNFASESEELYINGELNLTLTGETVYTVNKTWRDDNSENRPNCTLYLYRIAEDENHEVTEDQIKNASPVQGNDYLEVPTENNISVITFGSQGVVLPKYDVDGRKYIYFSFEKGLVGDYKAFADNSVSNEANSIIDKFNEILRDDGTVKYVLNNANLINALDNSLYTVTLTKVFKAQAMQSAIGASVKFIFEKMDLNGNWVKVDASSVISYDSRYVEVTDDGIIATLSDFKGEKVTNTLKNTIVNLYDKETGKEVTYRWREIAVSVGGPYQDVIMNEDGTYERTNVGVLAPGIGDEPTTAFCETKQEGNKITNTLVGDIQMHITKTWKDANGNTVTEMPEGSYALVNITRTSGSLVESTELGTLLDNDGNVVSAAELNNDNNWNAIIDNLPRFDDKGAEYTYKFDEAQFFDPDGRTWHKHSRITNSVVTDKNGNRVVEKAVHLTNYEISPEGIYFEIEKLWLDEGDLLSRGDVTVGVFHVETGALVATKTLTDALDYYDEIGITPVNSTDTIRDYVVKEISVNGVPVEYYYNNSDLRDIEFDYDYGASYSESEAVGVLRDDRGADTKLEYEYNVYIGSSLDGTNSGHFTIANQRFAKVALDFTKNWTTGQTCPDAIFNIKRNGEIVNIIDLLKEGAVFTYGEGDVTIANNGLSFTAIGEAVPGKDGKYITKFRISNLAKYDNDGNRYTYELEEIALKEDGVIYPITNGSTVIGLTIYHSSVTEENEKAEFGGRENHHDGDTYYWNANNEKRQNYALSTFKVWRDDGLSLNDRARPDITFSIYRMSAYQNNDLKALINSDDTESLVEYISTHKSLWEQFENDKIWNTRINDYYWSCNIGDVPRFDKNGYPYVYFSVENFASSAGRYHKAYVNVTESEGYRPTDIDGNITTKEVFSMDLSRMDGEDAVTILADGVHAGSDNSFASYYSATTVNYRIGTRDISGKKLWQFIDGVNLTDAEKPTVKISLYRFDESLEDENGFYSMQEVLNAVNSGKGEFVNDVELTDLYSFLFEEDSNGNKLELFDQFGRSYHYYLVEEMEGGFKNYITDEISVSATDFTILNKYTFKAPYVEVKVDKNWVSEIDGKVPDTTSTFELYAYIVDSEGVKIGEDLLMSKATISSDEDSYTFKYYTKGAYENAPNFNSANADRLPYYSPNNLPFVYYVVEKKTNGYVITTDTVLRATNDVKNELVLNYVEADEMAYANTEYTNIYVADKTTFTPQKLWNDSNTYMDNSEYRPESITVDVYRSWETRTINGVTHLKGEEFVASVEITKANNWKGVKLTDLDKYAPTGGAYTYFIKPNSERGTTEEDQRKLEYYTATRSSNSLSNKLAMINISAEKIWADGRTGGNLSWAVFNGLRLNGGLPTSVNFLVQQKTDDTEWKYLLSASSSYGVTIDGNKYVGQGLNISTCTESTYNNFKPSWTCLPTYTLDGEEYYYRVVEQLVWADGTISYYYGDNDPNNSTDFKEQSKGFLSEDVSLTITNTKYSFKNTVNYKDLKVEKIWDDENNRDGKRNSISIKLYESGEAYGNSVTLNKNNNYSYTFYLPAFRSDGTDTIWTIEEDLGVLTGIYTIIGYNPEDAEKGKAGITISETETVTISVTNHYDPEMGKISVSKVWDDKDNQDGYRKDSVKLDLYANDVNTGLSVVLSVDNNWEDTFKDDNGDEILLYAYEEGKKINYKVVESDKPDEYTAKYLVNVDGVLTEVETFTLSRDEEKAVTVKNIHEPDKMRIDVTKVWAFDSADDNRRPDEIIVRLIIDGEESEKTVSLNPNNNWKNHFDNLDVYKEQGVAIEYSVKEIEVKGYESVISGNSEDGFIITNNYYGFGNLMVSKTVTGDLGDIEKDFTFTVFFDSLGEYQYVGSYEGTIKSGDKFTLKHGESITILDLPTGTTYKVVESNNRGYTVTRINDEGEILKSETVECEFINDKSSVPDTGDNSNLLLWLSLQILSFFGFVTVLLKKKKLNEHN